MEFAAAALTSIGSTVAEVAGSVGTALTGTAGGLGAPAIPGLLTGLPSLSTTATILSGGATALSVLATQRAGEIKASNYEMQAEDAETQTGVETINGIQRRNTLKAQLVSALGDRDVAAAASGLDLSFGTPVVARQQAIKDGELALANDQDTENFRKSRLLERAASYRQLASASRSGALGAGAALALEGGAKIVRRG